ncbi:MAG: LacI family DNA-binding transcriptional regulator [Candidatus Halichondribacter symbioticus]
MGNKSSIVTMRDVAKAAGLSRMTVSRALKKDSPIAKETRDHVLKIVREMNYLPDHMAGSLSTKRSGFVAAILPSLNNLHFAQTVQGLTQELEKHGLQILLAHTDYSPDREEQVVETILCRRPEAIVLSYDGHTDRTRALLSAASIPVIEIWEQPKQPLNYTIGFSNHDAAYDMTKALIEKGYKRIVFLGEKNDDWTRGAARRRGFIDAMSAAGLPTNRIVQHGIPPLSIEAGAQAAPMILQRFPDVDCIFCVSDLPAFGLINGLSHLGKSVPSDISLVGFGNFEVSRFATPSISTVFVDPLEIGRQSGILINRLLGSHSPESGQKIASNYIVPTRLEFRDSTKL